MLQVRSNGVLPYALLRIFVNGMLKNAMTLCYKPKYAIPCYNVYAITCEEVSPT